MEPVTPLLKRVAHTISALEEWRRGVYSSILNVETKMESRFKIPGQKPRVDYSLCGYSNDTLLYCTSTLHNNYIQSCLVSYQKNWHVERITHAN